MMVELRALTVVVSTSIACHAHVDLKAPSVSAPVQERLDAFEDLQSTSYRTTVLFNGSESLTHSIDFMQLTNGTRVYYPEDLLTIVPPDSPTATAAIQAKRERRNRNIYVGAGLASAAAFFGYGFTALANDSIGLSDEDSTRLTIGLVGGLASLLTVGISRWIFSSRVADETSTAYETYNRSLRDHLALCEDDRRTVACKAPPTGVSAP